MESIEQIIKELLIDKLGVEADAIIPDASLENDLGIDSLDYVEIIMDLERGLNIIIYDDIAETANTVQDLIQIVEKLLLPKEGGELEVSVEMPKYKSHKEVWALKIKAIVIDDELPQRGRNRYSDGSAIITPEEEGYAPFKVDHAYMHKHKPFVGGYFVQHEGGYKSFSPAEAFEGGHTLLPQNPTG